MEDILLMIQPWKTSIIFLALFTLVRYIYKSCFFNALHRLAVKSSFPYDEQILEAFEKPINVVLFIGGIYMALLYAPNNIVENTLFIDRVLRSTIVLSFFWGCYNLSDATHGMMLDLLNHMGIRTEESLSNIFSTIIRIGIVVLGFVTIAKEWNYDISGFVASLGIGSLAVAFAAKDALANVFGSLIIILDKPFKIGDWITANGIEGTVEKISFRSTCIRTFPQELVYIPNSLLSNTPITNFTLRQKRRIDFILGVTYSTTAEQMEDVIEKMKNYLLSIEDMLYTDDIRVHFVSYGDSSLNIRISAYAKASTQIEYLDILQKINLRIMQILDEANVGCAFPSTSVYFETPLNTVYEIKKEADNK